MEIIGEIIFQIFLVILDFICELVVQIIAETVADVLGHSIKEPFRRPKPVNPWLAAIGYCIFGSLAGCLSLWFLPNLFIKVQWLRVLNIVLTPIAAALLMAFIGSWLRKHDKEVIRLDSFAYGYCFAVSMSLVRFIWGN
jgi:H+/Cl- antiporter ClcA